MSSKTVAVWTVALLWPLFAASVSAGPAVSSCSLQKNTVLEQSILSDLNRLFGEVLKTESNGNVYFVSICRPIPNTFYDPRKLAGAVKFTTEGHSIDLGRIDQTDVVVNEDGIVLTYVGGDKDTNSKDTCRGRRWRTYLTFVCDPSATNDVLTLIDEDPDQPEICQVRFKIKTAKTCVRQPNVPLNVLENDLIKQNASIENRKNTEKWEEIKANQIPSGDESFNNEIGKFSVSENAPHNKIEEIDSNQNYSRNTIAEFMPFVNKYLNVIDENKSKDKDNKDESLNKIFETRKKPSDNGNGVNSRYTNVENTSSKNETDSSVNEMKLNTTVNTENQTFHRENNDFETLKKHSDDGNKELFNNDVSSKYENHNFGKENKSVNYENKNAAEGNSFNNEIHYNGTNGNALNTTDHLHRNGSQNINVESKPLRNKNDNVHKENKPTNYEINTNNSNTIAAKNRSPNNEINDFETNTKRSENGNKKNSRDTAAEYKSSRNENDNSKNETKSSNSENKEDGSNTTTAEDHYGPKHENATNAQNTDSQDKSSTSENGSANKSVNDENREHDRSNDTSTIKSDWSDVEKRNRSDAENGKSSGNRSDSKPTETGAAGKNDTSSSANKTDDSNGSTRVPTTKTGNNDVTTAATAVVESSTNRRSNTTTSDRTRIENPQSETAVNGSSTTVDDNSTIKNDSSDVEKRNRSDAENGKSSGNRSDSKPTETGDKSAAGKNDTNANETDESNGSTRVPTTKTGNNDVTTAATAVVESSTNRRSNTTTSDRTGIENPQSETAVNGSSTTVDDKSPSNGAADKTKNVTPTTGRPASESDRLVPSNTSSRLSNTNDDGPNNAPTDVPSDANGTRLSAATVLGGLGLLSVLCAVAGTAVNRYYYKLTGTDQIPFKGTFQSAYSHVKAFVTKTFCCCVGGPATQDVTDEKSSLLQPKYVPGEERTPRKNEKHQTSSDDKDNTNGYGSMSNEKHSPTAGKKYRKKRSKSKSARVDLSDSGPDNVIPSKLLKTEDNLQGKSVKDVINEKISTIMKIKPVIKNIFGKTEKKFENADGEKKKENTETTSNEPSFVSQLSDGKSAKNGDDDGVRIDENIETDITEFPIKIIEESEKQSLDAKPNHDENVKSSSGFDVSKEQDDPENSKDKLINKIVDDLDSIRFELGTKPEKLFDAKKSIDSGGTETVKTDKYPNKFRFVGSGADEEEQYAHMRKEQPAEESDVPGRESVDNDDGSIETIEEVVYVDAESGEDGEEIVEETTETVTVSPSGKASTTTASRETSSSAAPGEETGDAVLASTPGTSVKKPFGFQLGIGKSGVNMSMGAKQLDIGRSGVKFGKRAEADGDGRDAMTIKLDKSGLKLNRDKKNAPRTSGETDGFDDAGITRDATSAHKKSKSNFTVFKRSVSQPIGSDVQEAEGDGVGSKKPSRSSAGLLKFGRSRSKSTGVMEADDGFTTDVDVLSSFIGHERYASSLSVDDVPHSEGTAGRRGNAISRSASGGNVTASSADYASVPSASSSFDRHGVLGDDVRLSVPSPKDGKDDGDRRPTKTNIKSKLNKFKKNTLNR